MKSRNKAFEERIYKTAESFLSTHGVKGWNMNELASAAGITKRTLYKIINSREQLVRDILFRDVYETWERFLEIINAGHDYIETLDSIISNIPELLKNSYIHKYSDILNEYPDIETEFVAETEKYFRQISSFLQSGIDKGLLREGVTPDFIYHTFQAIFIYYVKYSKTRSEAVEKIKEALYCLLHGGINRQSFSEPAGS